MAGGTGNLEKPLGDRPRDISDFVVAPPFDRQQLAGAFFPAEDLTLESLARSWKLKPQEWKKAIRLAYRKSILQETTAAEVRHWHAEILRIIGNGGVTIDGQATKGPPQPDAHACPSCPRSFSTIQGLTSHRRFAHGYAAPESQYVKNAVCPHCLRFLWSKARVRQHLAYTPRDGTANKCFAALQKRGYNPPEDSDTEEVYGHTLGINRRDALQAFGPAVEVVDAAADKLQEEQFLLTTLEEAFETKYNTANISLEFAETMSRELALATTAWFEAGDFRSQTATEATGALQDAWIAEFEEGPREGDIELVFIHWGREVLSEIIAGWFDGDAENYAEDAYYQIIAESDYMKDEAERDAQRRKVSRLQAELEARNLDQPHRPVKRGPAFKRGSTRIVSESYQRYLNHDQWQDSIAGLSIPAKLPYYRQLQGRPIFLIVHLFSGRRRVDDFHDKLANLVRGRPYDVHILSLDTAICKTTGNLAQSSATWKSLESLLSKGAISGGLAGPPCETFSAARYNEPSEEEKAAGQRWPRPLRTAEWPWGLQDLACKELRQLSVGSSLALQTLVVLVWLAAQGGMFLVEHPAPPQEPWKVSIFRTSIVVLLRSIPGIHLNIYCQGDWGASSTKPTGILSLNAPTLRSAMLRWRAPTPHSQRVTSIGRAQSGEFRTKHLKEYPIAFASGLAQCVADTLQRKFRQGEVRLSDPSQADVQWVEAALETVTVIQPEGQMLPDYQPELG